MRRDVVFVHIPKTGGTSVRVALEQTLKGHRMLQDYGPIAPETSPQIRELVHREQKASDFRKRFKAAPEGIFLSGHFPAERYWHAFNAESFVTFLRHPVDRIFSAFTHWVNHREWRGSFEEFIHRPDTIDRYGHLFANVALKDFGFIGFVEDFSTSVAALEDFIGAKISRLQLNTGNYEASKMLAGDLERYRPMVTNLCQADITLYERVREERAGRFAAKIPKAMVENGYLGNITVEDGIVVGWLTNPKREFLCEVEVYENGTLIHTERADQYRERLKERGVSRTGVCGFRIDLKRLISASPVGTRAISFRARKSEYELSNSPVYI